MKESKLTLVLNSHALSDYQSCPKRFYYSHIRKLEKAGNYRPFTRGTVITNLLAHYYRTKIANRRIRNSDIEEALDSILEPSELTDDDKALIQSRFISYHKHYRKESWIPRIVENAEDRSKGTGFSIVLYESQNIRFIYEGEPDLIVQPYPMEKYLTVVDHKSQSRRSNLYHHTNQFKGYCFSSKINRFVINYFGLQESGDENLWFRRESFHFTDRQLEQWKLDTISWYFKIFSSIKSKIMHRSWQCEGKYGVCSYSDLCESSYLPNIEEKQIQQFYKIKERKASW